MPANVSINLLDDANMEHTPIGRIVNWAVTYGRYIMIGTEIVVLLAFISRFSLDRKLTDLKEEVAQKEDILQANTPFEQEVRALQIKLAKVKGLLIQPTHAQEMLELFQSLLPPGSYITYIEIVKNKLSVHGTSGSTGSFAQFIANLQNTKLLEGIQIGDITRDPLLGISYSFDAKIVEQKPQKE